MGVFYPAPTVDVWSISNYVSCDHVLQLLTDKIHCVFIYIYILIRMVLSFCSLAIETTFPLSNFKTEHIFGILVVLRKFEEHMGRRRRPKFFINFLFTGTEGGGFRRSCPTFFVEPKRRRRRRSPGGTRETPPKAAVS